jgi:intracellular multiplication protein IcmJ
MGSQFLPELRLTAGPVAWRLYSARQGDPKFKAYEEKVFARDQYTCQFCKFQARTDQQIINIDGNYTNNKLDNLVTACCFCAQCFFIESVGVGGYGGGTLIFLPELSQQKLNALCHVLFCAMTNDTGYKNTAQAIYRAFKFRSQCVEDKFGEGTSDPAIMGRFLIDSDNISRQKMDEVFQEIRLLPSRAKFRQQIERWAANAVDELAEK